MKPENEAIILKQNEMLLSFRQLSNSTMSTYISYHTQFILWVETELCKPVEYVTWSEMCAYIDYLKSCRDIGNHTINVHIAQLHHLWQYILKRDWYKYEVPFLKFDNFLQTVPTVAEINAIIDAVPNIKLE